MIGEQRFFDYPAGFGSLPGYTAHAGQIVTVLRELGPDESDHHIDSEMEPMYCVRASDGWEGDAFVSELVRVPS